MSGPLSTIRRFSNMTGGASSGVGVCSGPELKSSTMGSRSSLMEMAFKFSSLTRSLAYFLDVNPGPLHDKFEGRSRRNENVRGRGPYGICR